MYVYNMRILKKLETSANIEKYQYFATTIFCLFYVKHEFYMFYLLIDSKEITKTIQYSFNTN